MVLNSLTMTKIRPQAGSCPRRTASASESVDRDHDINVILEDPSFLSSAWSVGSMKWSNRVPCEIPSPALSRPNHKFGTYAELRYADVQLNRRNYIKNITNPHHSGTVGSSR